MDDLRILHLVGDTYVSTMSVDMMPSGRYETMIFYPDGRCPSLEDRYWEEDPARYGHDSVCQRLEKELETHRTEVTTVGVWAPKTKEKKSEKTTTTLLPG